MPSASREPSDQPRERWPAKLIVLLGALVVADVISAFESSMIYAAFKSIIEETGDPAGAGWLVSVYFIVAGPAALVAGRLGDLYGRKQALIVILVLVTLGSLTSALSPSFLGMTIGRGMQGLSGAIMPLCIGMYRAEAPEHRLGVGLGILLSAHAIGTLLGLMLGGVIVDHASWRHVFHAGAAGGVVALVCIVLFAPLSAKRAVGRLDWLGFGVIPPMLLLLFVISELGKPNLGASYLAGLTLAGLLLLGLWIRHELRDPQPLVNLRAMRERNVAVANLIAFVVSMGPSQLGLYFALMLQQPSWTGVGFGLAASVAGVLKAPMNLVAAILGPLTGYSADRWGPRLVLVAGAALQLAGWIVVLAIHDNLVVFIAAVFLCSAGAMITNVGMTGIATLAVPAEKTSESVGVLNVSKSIGNALGAQFIGLLLGLSVVASSDGRTSYPSLSSHMAAVIMFVVLSAVAVVLAFTYRTARTRPAGKAGTEGLSAV